MNLKTMFKAMLLTVMLSTTQSVVADDFNSTRTDFRDERHLLRDYHTFLRR